MQKIQEAALTAVREGLPEPQRIGSFSVITGAKPPAPPKPQDKTCGIDTSNLPPLESAADFMRRNIPPLLHVVDGLITEGVTLLAAREKTGKTWFCYQLGGAVAVGQSFLGRHTMQGACLYFDFETGEQVRQERLKIMFPDGAPEDLYFVSQPDNSGPWVLTEGFENVIECYMEQVKNVRLVVIDVLDVVAPDQKRTETDKRRAYRTVGVLKKIARQNHIAIVFLMHFRKAKDDDFLTNISGSNGWAAASDCAIGIDRKRGAAEAVLQSDGRTTRGVELEIVQNPCTMRWSAAGTLEEMLERRRIDGFKTNEITKAVISVLEHKGGCWEGTSKHLIAEAVFILGYEITPTAHAVTKFIERAIPLFKEVYNISIYDRNRDNNATATWVMKMDNVM